MTSIPPASRANLRGAVDLSSLVRPPAAPAGAAPGAGTTVPSLVVESSDTSAGYLLNHGEAGIRGPESEEGLAM